MTTYPALTVPAFQAGYGPQASDFNTWWYNNASFMQNRVVFRASQATTATTLASSGASTHIAFDTVLEDPYSGWSGSPNYSWGPPAAYSGWYQVTMTLRTVTLPNLADLAITLGVWITDVPEVQTYTVQQGQGSSSQGAGVSGTFVVYLIGGEAAVTMYAQLLNSGTSKATSLTAGQQSTMEVMWLSSS